MLNNENLEMDFCLFVVLFVNLENVIVVEFVNGLFDGFVFKLVNICINEFLNVKIERDFKK